MIYLHTYLFSVRYGEFEKNKGNTFELFWQGVKPEDYVLLTKLTFLWIETGKQKFTDLRLPEASRSLKKCSINNFVAFSKKHKMSWCKCLITAWWLFDDCHTKITGFWGCHRCVQPKKRFEWWYEIYISKKFPLLQPSLYSTSVKRWPCNLADPGSIPGGSNFL